MMMRLSVLLLLANSVTSSQTADTVEELKAALSNPADYSLLMMMLVLCGAGMVGVIGALVHVVSFPRPFTLRSLPNNHHNGQLAEPLLKLFDRIEEFH